MKTDPSNQQPSVGAHASACPAEPFPQLSTLNLQPGAASTDTALQTVGRNVPVEPQLSAVSIPQPSTLTPQPAGKPRNGKIARLPKPVRDVVNRMLFNHISQENIVAALDEIGINVTQRNISNWKTHGGYREWCLAQEHAIQLHLHQDNLVDLLRRHDAGEIPEVGLQAAATQLSQFFLTPDARHLLASNPKEYERRVSMLSRISAQVKASQKYRDDCAKALGYKQDPERIRRETEKALEKLRDDFSCTIPDSPKDPAIPHRNHLPSPTQLFHCAHEEPSSKSPAPTFSEFVELLRQRSSAAKAQLTDGAPTKPSDA